MGEHALLYILFAPFLGALGLIFISNRQPLLVRGVAASSAFVSLIASIYLFYAYDPVKGGFQFVEKIEWSRQLGISLHLGVDGIGTPLVLASTILLFAGIFVSWHIKDRTKEFYIWLLILAAATIGVFMSLDLFFLYFFYDHNQDADSYFWSARRVLAHAPEDLTLRQAFVRLLSGGNDWNAIAPVLEREHARWEAGIQSGQTRAVPGSDVFRVRNTLNLTTRPAPEGPAA